MRHVLLGCCEVGGASQSHSRPCGDAGLLPSLNFNTPAHCSQPCMCFLSSGFLTSTIILD